MAVFIKSGAGTAKSALEQATSGLENPSLIIFCASYDIMAGVAKGVQDKYPAAQSIGVIGTHTDNSVTTDEGVTVVAFHNEVVAATGVVQNLSTCPAKSLNNIKENVAKIKPGSGDTVCIEFCTNNEGRLVTTLNACLSKYKIQLAGGSSFGAPEGKASIVAVNGKIYEDACAYAIIKNMAGEIHVYKENIYKKPDNAKAHFATKVDTRNNALIELDNRPAADVYCEEMNVPLNKVIDNVFVNPMGRAIGEDVSISSMKTLGANGTLYNFKQLNPVDCVYFLELGDYKAIGQETRRRIKRESRRISFIFSVSCIYRYLLYSKEGYFDTFSNEMAELGPHFGVVVGGEQFNNQHVNQTMVCAVFE